MADKQIYELTEITNINDSDWFAMQEALGQSVYKVKASTVQAYATNKFLNQLNSVCGTQSSSMAGFISDLGKICDDIKKKVNAINSSIGQIGDSVKLAGYGNYVLSSYLNLQAKQVTPSEQPQEVKCDSGYVGLKSVGVSGVQPAVRGSLETVKAVSLSDATTSTTITLRAATLKVTELSWNAAVSVLKLELRDKAKIELVTSPQGAASQQFEWNSTYQLCIADPKGVSTGSKYTKVLLYDGSEIDIKRFAFPDKTVWSSQVFTGTNNIIRLHPSGQTKEYVKISGSDASASNCAISSGNLVISVGKKIVTIKPSVGDVTFYFGSKVFKSDGSKWA